MSRRLSTLVIVVSAGLTSAAFPQGYLPDVAASKMTTLDALRVTLVASEPEIRQPILVKVDDRGRLWTIQYLQYPNPAGLTRVSVDRWSRTVYDRVPEPPPHGPRGADRITILTDTDGDGRADRFHDFVDGLNLATGLEFGHGGVYVLQVPYLLFYPDLDRNDVPEGDPRVLLSGFGMEDAQSLANHLTWGPDGWLYGVNGSTTTCRIRGIEFQQGVWRYHPLTDEFELFCEGGGNTFGLSFDERGNLFQSTNGGPFIHALQGAYYRKSFGKHGPLHNLHAYGFFETVTCDQVPGGPPTGGTIYLADAFPAKLRGAFISGNFLGHTASWWDLAADGATFTAKYGGVLLDSNDTWFGPTDVCLGPDGALYVSDFCDQRTAHPDPDANWDRSNGRIYRIEAAGTRPVRRLDLASLSTNELVDLLGDRNHWYVNRARIELAARRDLTVAPRLRAMALQTLDEQQSLQGLWGLHALGRFDEDVAPSLLDHPADSMRSWTVRLLGDRKEVSPDMARRLGALARGEKSPVVRCQLAASARRLRAADALPILDGLLEKVPDDADSRVPWMIWWGIEAKSDSDLPVVLESLADERAWQTPARGMQSRLLLRRWAAEGTRTTYDAAAQLLSSVPDEQRGAAYAAVAQGLAERSTILGGVEQGGLFEQFAALSVTQERPVPRDTEPVSGLLRTLALTYWQGDKNQPGRLRLALLCGNEQAYAHLLARIAASQEAGSFARPLIELLSDFGREDCVPLLLFCLAATTDEETRAAVVRVLGRFGRDDVAVALLDAYSRASLALQTQIIDVLFRRPESARACLRLVEAGTIDKQAITIDQLRTLALHEDDELNAVVRRLWGNIARGTPEEKLATMRRFSNDLRAASGDPARGKPLFTKHCATCHVLAGEGNKVGPDLTTANRSDQAALLVNIVDPSSVIRREYTNYTLVTTDGRIFTGLLAEQDAASVTVLDAKNQRTKLPRNDIENLRESDVSLMPEKLLEQLTPQELRDLFAYLKQ
jgi:putative membrane-bound dehydrogenase-like protein